MGVHEPTTGGFTVHTAGAPCIEKHSVPDNAVPVYHTCACRLRHAAHVTTKPSYAEAGLFDTAAETTAMAVGCSAKGTTCA
jgi:hypothetical protein